MERQDNRRILATLATSVLILCVLYPYPGYICIGLESLICLLLFSALILFVVKQTADLYDLVLASALRFAGFVFVDTSSSRFTDDVSGETFPVDARVLPLRFQLPPPLHSA